MRTAGRRRGALAGRRAAACAALLLAGCQTSAGELRGLAELPPLDYAVLVSGGTFLASATAGAPPGTFAGGADGEGLPIAALQDVLREGQVFRRVGVDPEPVHRRAVLDLLRGEGGDAALQPFLQATRDGGYDLLLVVEELQDGVVETQGTNGRWPITLGTWLLLGVGALIPDHTFESRATLRVTVRDLHTGRVLHDRTVQSGPVDLALVERGNVFGILLSLVVPPFWVGDDDDNARAAVRDISARRLLLSLARELKSDPVRQRLRERQVAALRVERQGGAPWLRVDAAEALSGVRLRAAPAVEEADGAAFERQLMASMQRSGNRFVYQARLPDLSGAVQVLVGTIAGNVASATFEPGRIP